uniref:Uncharacterized protein n=1 Tax=viral metagenome TaxID=1070528 RepID=A0A6C0BCI0_9ZZZZ
MANSMKSLMKTGFGLGIGLIGAQIVFLLIGGALFIPGFILYTKEKKKGNNGSSEQILGIALMGIGSLLMLGLGFGVFLNDLGDMF